MIVSDPRLQAFVFSLRVCDIVMSQNLYQKIIRRSGKKKQSTCVKMKSLQWRPYMLYSLHCVHQSSQPNAFSIDFTYWEWSEGRRLWTSQCKTLRPLSQVEPSWVKLTQRPLFRHTQTLFYRGLHVMEIQGTDFQSNTLAFRATVWAVEKAIARIEL